MELQKALESEAAKIIATIVGTLVLALWAVFRKLPKTIIIRITEKKHIEFVKKGSTINNIMNVLAEYSGAIYIHIIRYHNGKTKKFVVPNRMSVMWEEIGRQCDTCITKCRQFQEIPRIQAQWQNIDVNAAWEKLVEETEKAEGTVNTVYHKDMDDMNRAIWENLNIACYKEIFIKRRRNGVYTLGLSFCNRFSGYAQAEGMMSLAARQLKNLL